MFDVKGYHILFYWVFSHGSNSQALFLSHQLCVKNQVPQVFFKLAANDLMSVYPYEFADIIFCESFIIYEAISDYGAQ